VVPEVPFDHVDPPLVVVSTVPLAPTAKQFDADGQATPRRLLVVPEVCLAHDDPPFVEARITPLAPTAKHTDPDGHATPFS
jgi:hypothetical protein